MADLLGSDFGLAESHKLYDCHDLLLKHKQELFTHLAARWKDLFNAKFEVLLYDLTSTYFESDPAFGEADKRQFEIGRDTSELQSQFHLVCRLLLEKKKNKKYQD